MRKSYFNFDEKNKYNICDILLLDHSYLKECIAVLKTNDGDKKRKLVVGKKFLDALAKHSHAENKCVYTPLETIELFRKEIIEGKIEHNIADYRARVLKNKLARARTLSDEAEIELKVLAELVEHHVEEEESEMIKQMRSYLDEPVLDEIGMQFMRLRGFTSEDLSDHPILKREIPVIRSMKNRMPAHFDMRVQKGYSHK